MKCGVFFLLRNICYASPKCKVILLRHQTNERRHNYELQRLERQNREFQED